MNSFATPQDLLAAVGQVLGTSDWLTIDQAMIDDFARVTGDLQWIHVDVERARRDMPGGHTIAHGYLTLSLVPRLLNAIYEVRARSRAVNYGLDRVRFLSPVPSGGRIRLQAVLKSADPTQGGHLFRFELTVELEGAAKPAAVVNAVIALYP
jgi:acyl dehydratase